MAALGRRVEYLDTAAGVLISWMIIHHCILITHTQWSIISEIGNRLFFFFMPWFFYKSGMFHRDDLLEIKLGMVRFIRIFVIYSTIGHVVYVITHLVDSDTNLLHYTFSPIKHLLLYGSIEGNDPLWFLLSLIIVKYLFYNINKSLFSIVLMQLFCIIVGWILCKIGNLLPLYIANVATGLFFYSVGYKYDSISKIKVY